MNHIASPPEPVIRTIPLSRLDLAPENVRKTPAGSAGIAELKASIAAHGLLENLVARAQGPGPDGIGRYAVIAGGRRLVALQALVSDGVLDEDHPVPCLIAVNGDCGELSLAENVVRIAMHPADQVIAFYRLAESGVTVSAIATRFGVSERLVEQRLRLGNVTPELLDAYRAEEIDLETLKVFAVTTDHGRQRAVWAQMKDQGCRPGAWQVRRMLTEDRVPGTAAIARFVGIDAYEAAGGTITRDLFAQEDDRGIWFDDPALLNKLAMQKLQDTADELDTCWKWAEAAPELDWSATARFGRIRPEPAEPTDEERAELERLSARRAELADMDDEDWTGELVEEAEGIERRLDEIHAAVEARATFRPQDMAMAGCIATIGQDGALQVIQGLVRPEDMPETTGEGGDVQEAGNDGVGTESGRMDAPAINAPIASPADPRVKAREEVGVGIGLADDLRAIRTALVKAHLAKDYEAAFDLMLFQLARAVFTNGHRADALDVAVKETADRPTSRMNDEAFANWSPGEAMLADRSGLSLDWMEQEDEGESFAALRAPSRGGEAGPVLSSRGAHGQGPARLRAGRPARAGSHHRPARRRLREARAPDSGHALVAHQEGPDPRRGARDPGPCLGLGAVEVQEGRPRQGDGRGFRGRRPARRTHRLCQSRRSRLDSARLRALRHGPRGGAGQGRPAGWRTRTGSRSGSGHHGSR